MTIGKLAAISGIPTSTIRYWERIGILPKPPRVNGQRCYGPDARHWLALLRLAQASGFHLEEMRHFLFGFERGVKPRRRWQELALRKQREIDFQISQLQAMRRVLNRVQQCECLELKECGRIAASVLDTAL